MSFKKSFSLIELIFVLVLIGITLSFTIPNRSYSDLDLATQRVITYLKHTRYLAMIDNKYQIDDPMWYKERWTLKFQNCSKSIGGLYFVVFSDENRKGSPNKDECAKDPLNSRWLYSHWDCNPSQDESKNILLTKKYGVTKVNISCNATSTIGQISFDKTGQAHARLGTKPEDIDKYRLNEKCFIRLYDKEENFKKIAIEPNTGYIYEAN